MPAQTNEWWLQFTADHNIDAALTRYMERIGEPPESTEIIQQGSRSILRLGPVGGKKKSGGNTNPAAVAQLEMF